MVMEFDQPTNFDLKSNQLYLKSLSEQHISTVLNIESILWINKLDVVYIIVEEVLLLDMEIY